MFFMLKRDLDELELDAQRPAPTWTTEERLELKRILSTFQQATERQYLITQQWRYKIIDWWKMIAWRAMLVRKQIAAAIRKIFS